MENIRNSDLFCVESKFYIFSKKAFFMQRLKLEKVVLQITRTESFVLHAWTRFFFKINKKIQQQQQQKH